ncbi:MAG TPA: lipid-A-disaccharide synthase N-terminal domain-containing protein [Rhizomicrobium sp.]|jgi:lipid-A-disaccharide synthase-like uncharacterized protein|nr:lipid-A-disaccharide synthase N-terminal domain-containing protein [Rhizomicrobium sp.]
MGHLLSWLTIGHIWLAIGFIGQGLFASRFILQWFKSEMEGRSVIPVNFWYCSLGGGIVLLAYAIHKLDPVFILGQASGLIVYSRNLYLIFRERTALHHATQGAGPQ